MRGCTCVTSPGSESRDAHVRAFLEIDGRYRDRVQGAIGDTGHVLGETVRPNLTLEEMHRDGLIVDDIAQELDLEEQVVLQRDHLRRDVEVVIVPRVRRAAAALKVVCAERLMSGRRRRRSGDGVVKLLARAIEEAGGQRVTASSGRGAPWSGARVQASVPGRPRRAPLHAASHAWSTVSCQQGGERRTGRSRPLPCPREAPSTSCPAQRCTETSKSPRRLG